MAQETPIFVKYVGQRSGVQKKITINGRPRPVLFNRNTPVGVSPGTAKQLCESKLFERCDPPKRTVVSSNPKREAIPQNMDQVRAQQAARGEQPGSKSSDQREETAPQTKERQTGDTPEASKAAVELAQQEGIDLANVTASGTDGRINVNDVKAAISERAQQRGDAAKQTLEQSVQTD